MNNSKPRWLTAALMAVALLLAACGGSTESVAADPEPTAETAPTATEEPVATTPPAPTATPEPEPTATPEPEPTEEPTATPEPEPTEEPTVAPEPEPTEEPTVAPEPEPTEVPAADDAAAADGAGGDTVDETAPEETTSEEDAAPADSATTPVVDGAAVYAGNCARCHAADGSGTNLGPNIATIGQFFTADASPITMLVRAGGTQMPEFGSKLSTAEIDAVVTYVVETFQ